MTAWHRVLGGRRAVLLSASVGAALFAACAEIGTEPSEPAAIELTPFASPSIVIGDTLRDVSGAVAPVRAIVRNVRGDEIADASVLYFYAPSTPDTALVVDEVTGIVRALKASSAARVAARVGSSLQVLRSIVVTTRPDSLTSGGAVSRFTTTFPDTGRTGAVANSVGAPVQVRHLEGTVSSGVNGWPVTFAITKPANATNDTTQAVYLVNDAGIPSVLDTSDAGGSAARRVRVRALQFPVGDPCKVDTVVVSATASYRGKALLGAPVTINVPIRRGPCTTP